MRIFNSAKTFLFFLCFTVMVSNGYAFQLEVVNKAATPIKYLARAVNNGIIVSERTLMNLNGNTHPNLQATGNNCMWGLEYWDGEMWKGIMFECDNRDVSCRFTGVMQCEKK